MVHRVPDKVSLNGGCSSIGRAPDCDSGRCEFESHQSPAWSFFVISRIYGESTDYGSKRKKILFHL